MEYCIDIQYDWPDAKTAADSRFHPEIATDGGRNTDLPGNRRPVWIPQPQLRDGAFAAAASEKGSRIRTGQGAVVARHVPAGEAAQPNRGHSAVWLHSGRVAIDTTTLADLWPLLKVGSEPMAPDPNGRLWVSIASSADSSKLAACPTLMIGSRVPCWPGWPWASAHTSRPWT